MNLNIDIFAAIILGIVHCTFSDHILSCNVTDLEACPGDNHICIEASSECGCIDGYTKVGDNCTRDVPGASTNHDTTAAVVSIFTIASIGCVLVVVFLKYKLMECIFQKFSTIRNNDVMYEDVMIGQDDPPLNP